LSAESRAAWYASGIGTSLGTRDDDRDVVRDRRERRRQFDPELLEPLLGLTHGRQTTLGRMTLAAVVAAVAAAGSLLAGSAAPLKVTVAGAGHTPKVGAHWTYSVTVTRGGKPVAAKLTAQIVDPLGGSHPVQLGSTKVNVIGRPIRGTFRDFILWPKSSQGIPLTLRIVVTSGGAKRAVSYAVTSHG
jgi:hypothetical protein